MAACSCTAYSPRLSIATRLMAAGFWQHKPAKKQRLAVPWLNLGARQVTGGGRLAEVQRVQIPAGICFCFKGLFFRAGFSAFWLLWLLRGFLWLLLLFISLSACLFASSALPVPLRQVAFWLCGFWRLSGFGFLHPLLSQLVFGLGFLHPQHRKFLSSTPRHPPCD